MPHSPCTLGLGNERQSRVRRRGVIRGARTEPQRVNVINTDRGYKWNWGYWAPPGESLPLARVGRWLHAYRKHVMQSYAGRALDDNWGGENLVKKDRRDSIKAGPECHTVEHSVAMTQHPESESSDSGFRWNDTIYWFQAPTEIQQQFSLSWVSCGEPDWAPSSVSPVDQHQLLPAYCRRNEVKMLMT